MNMMESDKGKDNRNGSSHYRLYEDGEMMLIDSVKVLTVRETVYLNRNVIAFCSEGRMTAMHNGTPITVQKHQVFICPPGSQLSGVMITPDFEFIAVAITNTALQRYLREYIGIWNQFAYVDKISVLSINWSEGVSFYDFTQALLRLLADPTMDGEEARYRHEMLKGTMHVVLIALCNLLRKQALTETWQPRQNVSYFSQFLDLLQNTKHKHQTVEYYASKLCISTKYLTEICKKNSEKTAGQWIHEYLMADITHYLLNTDLSIKEIASKVNFDNTSFFSKYVKKALGCTPTEYRINKRRK